MNIHAYNFETLAQVEWNYPRIDMDSRWTQLLIKASDADVSGGVIRKDEIDRIADYPDAKSVSIGGLRQDTFEYFIKTYGRQFRYISFFKIKALRTGLCLRHCRNWRGYTGFIIRRSRSFGT